MKQVNDLPFIYRATVGLIFIIALVFFLIAAKNLLYPIGFAILIAYLLYPIVFFLDFKLKFPRWASCLVAVLFGVFIIGTTLYFSGKQLASFVANTPQLTQKMNENVEEIQKKVQDKTNISTEKQDELVNQQINSLLGEGSDQLNKMLKSTINSVVNILLLPVFTFFMLFYRKRFYRFIKDSISRRYHQMTENILNDVSQVTRKYMTGILTVVAILCVLNSVGLYIVGAKYALLLGVISAIFNFIPYFGTVIGGAIALLMSLATQGDTSVAVGIIILFVIIQFLENNILTPKITGGKVKLNPFITILSIIVGGMIWGVPGMFLSVPFLGMFKILCDNVDGMQHIGRVLSA